MDLLKANIPKFGIKCFALLYVFDQLRSFLIGSERAGKHF